jgi:site-specific recombinase XerD
MARGTVYNNIQSDELWEKVNKENKILLSEFLDYLRSTDKSSLTVVNYESDLKIIFTWCLLENENKFFVNFTKRDVIRCQNYLLNEMNLGSSRVRRMKSTMSSLSNYIENVLDDEYKEFRNIINKIPHPAKNEVREKTILTDDQQEYLLNYLVEHKEYQKACAVALAIASGSRKSELLRFKVSYFTDENIMYGSLYKTPEKIKTKGRGKSGKLLNKYVLVNVFKPYFDLWIKERKELGITNDELFVVKEDNAYAILNQSSLNSWAKHFSNILGISWYWHSNRHYFTTSLCKANIPAEVIKDVVGWSSIDLVSVYNDSDVDDELGKFFDANGIKSAETKSLSDL